MTIEKRALRSEAYLRPAEPFPRAREAFGALLSRVGVPERGGVLLPAYIGWSPKDGSGVFDPVCALGSRFAFYRVTRSLHIDMEDLARALLRFSPRVLLLIHYFGYPDPSFREAAGLGREAGAIVVEDEAHALLSDLVGGACGREGDAVFFSLHKMLPLDSGGLLALKGDTWRGMPGGPTSSAVYAEALAQYDLVAIARKRMENARSLAVLLSPLAGRLLHILRPQFPAGVVPQTFPVVLQKAPRNEIYERMNGAGFGVVSLYHTMVDAIPPDKFPDSHWLSRRILNLPIHQDVSTEDLKEMVDCLGQLLREHGRDE